MQKQSQNKKNKITNKQTIVNVSEKSELLNFLIKKFPDKNRRTLKSLLSNKQIAINYNNVSQFNYILEPGDELVISWDKSNIKDFTDNIKILFEDNSIVVVEKNAKLLSVANEKEKRKAVFNILIQKLRSENPKNQLFVTHRLDKGVSGLMIFAKSKDIQTKLLNAWKNLEITQKYYVIVEGLINRENGTIKSYLKENTAHIMYSVEDDNEGMLAITHFDLMSKTKHFSLLEVNLETKRKNQMRVHFKELGNPVVGDKKYGAKSNSLGRLGIHAYSLSFTHPVNGKLIKYELEMPNKFKSLVKK